MGFKQISLKMKNVLSTTKTKLSMIYGSMLVGTHSFAQGAEQLGVTDEGSGIITSLMAAPYIRIPILAGIIMGILYVVAQIAIAKGLLGSSDAKGKEESKQISLSNKEIKLKEIQIQKQIKEELLKQKQRKLEKEYFDNNFDKIKQQFITSNLNNDNDLLI